MPWLSFASHLNPPLTLYSFLYSSHISLQILTSFFPSESLAKERVFVQRRIQSGSQIIPDCGTRDLERPCPNVIVLVLGMYSCPDAADRNCLRPGIDEIAIQSVARLESAKPFKHWCIKVAILKIILCRRGNQWRSRNTGEMWSYFLAPVMNLVFI